MRVFPEGTLRGALAADLRRRLLGGAQDQRRGDLGEHGLARDHALGDALAPRAVFDEALQPGEGAAADEQDVRGVDLDELLVRVLAPALRRNARRRALEDLEQRLLHALARDVARDRRVLGLAGDLVDL